MFLPRFLLVPSKTRCIQVTFIWIFVFLVHLIHRREEYCLSVFQILSSLVSILNSWWNVNWLHIRCDKCTRRNRPELIHCLVMKDQWNCVLKDLEELGGKEFLMKDQYNTEIFSCFLLHLQLCSSTFHQTNVENAQNGSEDNLLISRVQSLHHLLESDWHDEEDWSVSSTLDNRWAINLVVLYRSKFFSQ